MNISTEALRQSTLYNSSIQGGNINYDSFRYDLEKSYPNIFKDKHTKVEFSGLKNASAGAAASVEVPAFGLAREMYLKTTISYVTPTVDANQVCNVAAHLYKAYISRVALLNSSREICQMHGDTLQWKAISRNDRGEKMKWLLAGKHNLMLNKIEFFETANNGENSVVETKVGDAVAQTLTFYTDLPWPQMEGKFQSDDGRKTSALNNFRFLETCRVLLETAPQHEIVAGTAAGTSQITGFKFDSCHLYVNYDIPSSEDMMEIEKSFSLDQPLSILVGDEVLTQQTVAATSTSTKADIKIFNTTLAKGFLVCCHANRSEANAVLLGAAITDGTSNGSDDLIVPPADATKTEAIARHIVNPSASMYHSIAATDISRYGQDYKKLNSLTVKSSGRLIFEADTYEQLMLCTSNMTNWLDVECSHAQELSQMFDKNSCNGVNFYWIPFCDKPNINSFSGGLGLKGLATCDISLEFPSISGVSYQVKVYTIHHKVISVDAAAGRLVSSVAS